MRRLPICPGHGEIPCGCETHLTPWDTFEKTAALRRSVNTYRRDERCVGDRYMIGLALSEIALKHLHRIFQWAAAYRAEQSANSVDEDVLHVRPYCEG